VTTTSTALLAVIVTKADGGVTRIGPIPTPDVADAIHTSLTRLTTIPEQAAATAEIVPFTPGMPHLPLLDAEVETVLALMDDDEQGVEAPFPNIWDRLVAQHGLGTANTVWREALAVRSNRSQHTPGVDAQRAPRAHADARFDQALRELLLESTGPGGISPAALDETLASIRRLADAWARSRRLPSSDR
jgi:hypothetical protein